MRRWIWALLALCCFPLLAAELKPQRLPQPGDLESILQKRELRALVVYERGFYFLDRGAQYGILVNQLQGFERWLNKTYLAKEKVKLKVVYIPVRQDKLLDYLTEGRGDLVAATMTVTPTRREQVAFSRPLISSIEEWVVSQQSLPAFSRITQLSGRRVWVRASSSYYESLRQLNWLFRELGLPPVYIETVPEYLQDGDLLEMVAAGIIPLTVTDSYKGRIWLGGMISGLKAHKLIPLRSNGTSAWALRKNSPELLKAVNGYLASVSRNSLYSDMTLRRLAGSQRSDEQYPGAGSYGAPRDHSQGAGEVRQSIRSRLVDAGGAWLQGVRPQSQGTLAQGGRGPHAAAAQYGAGGRHQRRQTHHAGGKCGGRLSLHAVDPRYLLQ